MSEAPDLSIEEELKAAIAQHTSEPEEEPVIEPERDEGGRFKAKEEEVVPEAEAAPENAEQQEVSAELDPYAEPPRYAKKSIRENWSKFDPEIRKDLTERENEAHQQFTRFDEERQIGRRFKEASAPYDSFLKSLGADGLTAFDYLIKTDYALRTAQPEQRTQMFVRAAQDYGVNLSELANVAQAMEANFNPEVYRLQQQINRLESSLRPATVNQSVSVDNDVIRHIEDFASKPEHVHFSKVQPLMQALLASGQAETLEEAYDLAVHANPETRALRLAEHAATEERKRTEAAAAKAEAARRASVSVTGAPGLAVPTPPMESSGSIEDDVRNAIRAVSGG